MAVTAAPLTSGHGSECDSPRTRCGCPGRSGLQQPQDKVAVAVGETLTLKCSTFSTSDAGGVRWLKGWGSDNKTIYDQKMEFPHVTRAVNGSDTDFTIHIRNVTFEDMGTYYCVKYLKEDSGEDTVFQCGRGTEVSVHETALVPGMVAAAVVLCFLFLLGLFVALCLYRRKRQGGVGSLCPARTVAMGSFSSVPAQCCAGTPGTPSEVLDAESSHLPRQQSIKEENNIHYAYLQPLPAAPRRSRSLGTAPTEYASLRAAAR